MVSRKDTASLRLLEERGTNRLPAAQEVFDDVVRLELPRVALHDRDIVELDPKRVGSDLRRHGGVAVALAHGARKEGGSAARVDDDAGALQPRASNPLVKTPRRCHAAHLRVRRYADAAVAAAGAELRLLRSACCVVEHIESLIEASLAVAAVAHHALAAVGAIGEVRGTDEVEPPHLDGIETEPTNPLHEVGRNAQPNLVTKVPHP